jgi:hypothetical protein
VGVRRSERVTSGSGVDSMLRLQLERGDDGTKYCRKMKRRQRAHLSSMGRKRDMAWLHRPGETRHQGGKREETTSVGMTRILIGQKIKKTHAVDSAATNK